MDNNYTVYKHTAPNGKVYIGITSIKPEYRWNNGKGYEHQKLFYRAINKYGWNNLKHEILFENLSKKLACKAEQELIKYYKSNNSKYGYNNSIGGECGNKGAKLSEETRNKMSASKMGELNSFYGKHHSEETRNKWSKIRKNTLSEKQMHHILELAENNKGRKMSKERKEKFMKAAEKGRKSRMHKIICIETQIIYEGFRPAERATGINRISISRACKGIIKTAGGYHWEYIEET